VTIDKTVEVAAPAADLWAYVTDWPRHGEWVPLTKVETVGGAAREVGGRLRAWSGLGPIGFWDPLTVTAWEENDDGGGRCAFVHTGRVVRGDAELTVTALGPRRSSLRWLEQLEFGRLSRLAWRVGGPVIEKGLEHALRRLARIVEGPTGERP
jgi:hypothetical protein